RLGGPERAALRRFETRLRLEDAAATGCRCRVPATSVSCMRSGCWQSPATASPAEGCLVVGRFEAVFGLNLLLGLFRGRMRMRLRNRIWFLTVVQLFRRFILLIARLVSHCVAPQE